MMTTGPIPTGARRAAYAILAERIAHLCEKLDDTDERIDGLAKKFDELRSVNERLASLEGWHTWGVRAILGVVIVEALAVIFMLR